MLHPGHRRGCAHCDHRTDCLFNNCQLLIYSHQPLGSLLASRAYHYHIITNVVFLSTRFLLFNLANVSFLVFLCGQRSLSINKHSRFIFGIASSYHHICIAPAQLDMPFIQEAGFDTRSDWLNRGRLVFDDDPAGGSYKVCCIFS